VTQTKRDRAAKWRLIAEQYDRDAALGLCFAAAECGIRAYPNSETQFRDDLHNGPFAIERNKMRGMHWWGDARTMGPKARERCINGRVIGALLLALTLED